MDVARGAGGLRARKPAWKAGASFALRRAPPPAAAAAASAPPPPARSWRVDAGGLDDDDEELVDEESLLTDADRARPPPPTDAAGAPQARSACANCTCGRAEASKKVSVDAGVAELSAALPASACGSCYLGDAYRCAGCPYLGKPAFTPGAKVVLSGGGMDE